MSLVLVLSWADDGMVVLIGQDDGLVGFVGRLRLVHLGLRLLKLRLKLVGKGLEGDCGGRHDQARGLVVDEERMNC